MPSLDKDVVIVGGGPVGASLALSLKKTSLRLGLVEARPPAPVSGWDSRIYAVSPKSRDWLNTLRIWEPLKPERLTPIRRMLVFGDRASRLEFSAYDTGVPELAWTLEAGALASALWDRLQSQDNLELICPAVPTRLHIDASARLDLDSGRSLGAGLIVGADGGNSFVRREARIEAHSRPYEQQGVVANFSCRRPHRGTAFQWFMPDGVLAWLPLAGERISMVWSTADQHAAELMSMAPAQLARSVADAGGQALGELDLLGPPLAFPLTRLKVARMTAPHIALVGDAAHVVHPLAGQGVNLGLSDAWQLGRILAAAPGVQMGDAALLRRYERARGEDIFAMRWATDGLATLFSAPALRGLRNLGLNSVDRMPVLKALLVRHALG